MTLKDPLEIQRHKEIESKRMEKDIWCNSNLRRAGVAVLISDKIDLKMRNITKAKEEYFLMMT